MALGVGSIVRFTQGSSAGAPFVNPQPVIFGIIEVDEDPDVWTVLFSTTGRRHEGVLSQFLDEITAPTAQVRDQWLNKIVQVNLTGINPLLVFSQEYIAKVMDVIVVTSPGGSAVTHLLLKVVDYDHWFEFALTQQILDLNAIQVLGDR